MLVTVKYLAFECRALAKICRRNGGGGRGKGLDTKTASQR